MGDYGGKSDSDTISKKVIFETIASEAAGLYNLLITIATGMFGATLVFLDKISPSPTRLSIVFLGLGWVMLIVCMLLCAWIRWKNLESGRFAMEGKFDEAKKIDRPNRVMTRLAILTLALGTSLLGAFGLANVVDKVCSKERNVKMCESPDKGDQKRPMEKIIEKAIPFGSTEQPAAELPQEVADTTNADGDKPPASAQNSESQ